MDKVDERLARMEELLHQLIGLVGKTNSGMVDLESRLNQRMDGLEQRLDRLDQRMDGLEQRLDHIIGGHHRDVTILKSESDHLARKVGVLERTLRFCATHNTAAGRVLPASLSGIHT